jgi:uncharacterized membrane protein
MDETIAYKIRRAVVAIFVAAGMGLAVGSNQPLVAIAVVGIGMLMLWMLRARYKAVILVDERIKRIGEKAASTALWFFLVATAFTIMVELMLESVDIGMQQIKEIMEPLSFITIGIMAVYAVLVRYYSSKM